MEQSTLNWINSLKNYSPEPNLGSDLFYNAACNSKNYRRGLIISGPSRNGNHLLHSLLDSHPNLPRIPGEDSAIEYAFKYFNDNFKEANDKIINDPINFLINLSGLGKENKWKKIYSSNKQQKEKNSKIWSGMYYGKGEKNFLYDYQNTFVDIDYQAYKTFLDKNLFNIKIKKTSLFDIFYKYMQALTKLDADFNQQKSQYDAITFGSGSRGSLEWLLSRGHQIYSLIPVRPFETYYYSFSKGFYGTLDVRNDILKEAWEHWHHKVADYMRIKLRFSNRVKIVNFEKLILDTKNTISEVCKFLDIDFNENCLTPSVFGIPTKGNSSIPKVEKNRGKVYGGPIKKRLDKNFWPKEYEKYWEVVEILSE